MTEWPAIKPPEAILETALYVADLDEAARFYGDLIGLEEVTRAPGRHLFYGCGPGMLLLFVAEATEVPGGPLPVPPHGARGEGHVCFRVPPEDLDGWAAHFEGQNIEIEADFRWPSGARSIYVRDPDRNSVEVSEPKLWGRPL
ncbi:MAG: VOC family protein [Pseudomonadota bacterium]